MSTYYVTSEYFNVEGKPNDEILVGVFSKDNDEKWLKLAARYDKEFDRIFELHKHLDEAKFGLPRHIRDVDSIRLAGTDWDLDHDSF